MPSASPRPRPTARASPAPTSCWCGRSRQCRPRRSGPAISTGRPRAREAASLADRMHESFFGALARLHLAGALQAAGDAAGAAAELAGLDSEATAPLLDLSAGRGWDLLVATRLDLGEVAAAADAAERAER